MHDGAAGGVGQAAGGRGSANGAEPGGCVSHEGWLVMDRGAAGDES